MDSGSDSQQQGSRDGVVRLRGDSSHQTEYIQVRRDVLQTVADSLHRAKCAAEHAAHFGDSAKKAFLQEEDRLEGCLRQVKEALSS